MPDAMGAVPSPDPTDPKNQTQDVPKLSNEERLELSLIETQKKLLQAQAQSEATKLETATAALIGKVQDRLKIDLSRYKVDLESGACTLEGGAGKA